MKSPIRVDQIPNSACSSYKAVFFLLHLAKSKLVQITPISLGFMADVSN